MRSGLALWVVVVVVVVSGSSARESRLSGEEREAVLRRLQKDYKGEPVCVPPTSPSSKPPPSLAASYTTQLELTHQEDHKHKVVYGAEAFDRVLNRGLLHYELKEGIILGRPHDTEEIIHYNLVTNESLIIITNTACEVEGDGNCDPKKSCTAESVKSMEREIVTLFGLGAANGKNGYYGISGILQWLLTMPSDYSGQMMCRGMLCDIYEVCIKGDKGNDTALITYFWSLPEWTVDGNREPVPLAIEVVSTAKIEPYFTRAVRQRYDFYQFYSNVRPDLDVLEPPADVYCKNRVSKLDPISTPRFFSYSSEAIAPVTLSLPIGDNEIGNVEFTIAFTHEGYYDWDSKIVTLDYVPWYILGQEYRYEYETKQVQEFNQGLNYFMYKHLEECHVKPIENTTSGGDVVVNTNGTVSLLPPWMFVDLDGAWQYNGLHEARGVEADVWVGQKNLLGPFFHENYVSYYASPLVFDELGLLAGPSRMAQSTREARARRVAGGEGPETYKYASSDKVPMRLEQYRNYVAGKPHLLNNIYNYQTQPPHTQSIDISLCYNDTTVKMRHFLLELPPDSLAQVMGLEDNLLHAAQMALSEAAVISPLRVNKEMLDIRDGKAFILFTLLPLPSVVGDAPMAVEESDLDTAADLITSTVQNSKLIVVVHLQGVIGAIEPVYIPLMARSIQEVTRNKDNTYTFTTDQGYVSGDMAGLAFGVLLLGVLVGVAVFVVIQQRGEGKGGLPRVTMARKSPLSPANTINISSDMTASDI